MITQDIKVELWPIGRLMPRAANPRTHTVEQVNQIAASIRRFGWTNPILVGAEGDIIAGHGRLMAAKTLGMDVVPVIVLAHLSEAQRRALVIADNQLALNAGWDEEMLRVQLAALREEDCDLDLLGFDDQQLARLLADQDEPEELKDPDAMPEITQPAIANPGDLWILGEHRLYVGDATLEGEMDHLIDGQGVDLVFTDPSSFDWAKRCVKASGDGMIAADFRELLARTLASCRRIVKPWAAFYVCHSVSWQRGLQEALAAASFEIRNQIIWAKNAFASMSGRYKVQHEPIFYCHLAGQEGAWYGDQRQTTLWTEDGSTKNRLHPAAKPVELIERALLNSSQAGDVVLDLFGGCGSTLIACHRLGRKARLMECNPTFADCICRRFENFAGQPAVLSGDGRTFGEIARERQEQNAA